MGLKLTQSPAKAGVEVGTEVGKKNNGWYIGPLTFFQVDCNQLLVLYWMSGKFETNKDQMFGQFNNNLVPGGG